MSPSFSINRLFDVVERLSFYEYPGHDKERNNICVQIMKSKSMIVMVSEAVKQKSKVKTRFVMLANLDCLASDLFVD